MKIDDDLKGILRFLVVAVGCILPSISLGVTLRQRSGPLVVPNLNEFVANT